MSLSQDQVVDYVKNLRLGEVKDLIRVLENELGVKAAAPTVSVVPGQPPNTPEPVPERTEFDVVLSAFDADKKVGVIKVVREITGLGLKEAKALVEAAPTKVKEGLAKAAAEEAVAALAAAGGRARAE